MRMVVRVVVALIVSTVVAVRHREQETASAFQSDFSDQVILSGLSLPTDVEFAPDGRVFVAEKSGLIQVFDSLGDPSAAVVMDLRTPTHTDTDRGLLAIELDPNFAGNRRLYALHTYDRYPPGHPNASQPAPVWGNPAEDFDVCTATGQQCLASSRLFRFQVPTSAAQLPVPAGQGSTVLWEWCEPAYTHTVGDMEFGPDGMLYVSHGESAWPNPFPNTNDAGHGQANPCGDPAGEGGMLRAQDPRTTSDPYTLDGTVIRIDPATGAGASGNPLFASPDLNAKRIVAYGFRNPFRITLRPDTNDLYIADVGRQTWDEINRVPDAVQQGDQAANFGWPCYEGAPKHDSFDVLDVPICEGLYGDGTAKAPLFAYRHSQATIPGGACPIGGQASVTGLEFVEGNRYGSQYAGALFFAEYARGCIFAMRAGPDGVPDPAQAVEIMPAGTPVDLELGPDGYLYYVDIVGGSIHRVVRSFAGGPPTASLVVTQAASDPLAFTFDARGSTDPDGTTGLSYAWDLDGNGSFETTGSALMSHTYLPPRRTIDVGVRVADPTGQFDTAAVRIYPGDGPPSVSITSPAVKWGVGDTVNFAATATDPDDGALPGSAFEWSVRMLHCPTGTACHVHFVGGLDGTKSGQVVGPDHEMTTKLEIVVKVTDSIGHTTTASQVLDARTVNLTLSSQPQGASLNLNGHTFAAPRTETVITGSTNSVAAPATGPGGAPFVSWSDRGAPSHLVQPTVDTSLVATYQRPTPPPPPPPPPPTPPPPGRATSGYWLLEQDGDVSAFGKAPALPGVKADLHCARAVAIAAHPGGLGFWVLLSDGRVIARGAAPALGSANVAQLTKPGERVATMSATPSGSGVWVFSSAGRVMALGDALPGARMSGTEAILALTLDGPIIDSVATPSGHGAYMVASDGGLFTVGDAAFIDSVRGQLTKLLGPPGLPALPVVGIVPDPDGDGYWMVAADGGVFSFRASFRGSLPGVVPYDRLFAPVNGMVPYGNGYLLVASDGGVFTFSNLPFEGSGSGQVDSPVIGIAAGG